MKRQISITILLLFLVFPLWSQDNSEDTVLSETGYTMAPYHEGTCETATYYDDSLTGMFPKNKVSLYKEAMNTIIQTFLTHPLMKPPVGFDARFEKKISDWNKFVMPNDYPTEPESKFTADIEIPFSPYFLADSRYQTDFHVNSRLLLCLNNPYNIAGTPLMEDIYPCPQKIDDFHGYPVFITDRAEVTIINYTDKPLFLPVSQEKFINTVIVYWNSVIKKDQLENERYKEESGVFYSKEAQQQRKEEFEKAYNELLKFDKKAAEDLKKTVEETMPALSEPDKETDVEGSIGFARKQIEILNRELAAMSPAERKRQAYYSVEALEKFNNASGLLPESLKNYGDALVIINPELIDDGLDKIQLVSLHWFMLDKEHYDSPRLMKMNTEPSLITDNKMLQLYSDKKFWVDLFQKVRRIND